MPFGFIYIPADALAVEATLTEFMNCLQNGMLNHQWSSKIWMHH